MPQLAPHIVRRLMKELAAVREDAHITHLSIESKNGDDDISCLKGSFPGPKDSPYEGGTFWVDIVIPLEYPFKPPHMKFITRVWHPNVSSQTVCPAYSFFLFFIFPLLLALSSRRFLSLTSSTGHNLSRHNRQSMVTHLHSQIHLNLPTITPRHTRAQ